VVKRKKKEGGDIDIEDFGEQRQGDRPEERKSIARGYWGTTGRNQDALNVGGRSRGWGAICPADHT